MVEEYFVEVGFEGLLFGGEVGVVGGCNVWIV